MRRNSNITAFDLMKDVIVVIDDQGRKMEEEDIHPGAFLIGYQQGFEPFVFAVVSPEFEEVPESDADDAVDEYIQKEFTAEEAEKWEEEGPTYMVRVTEDDLPEWPVSYIVEYTRTDAEDWSTLGWGLLICEKREDPEYEVLSAIKERFIEEVFSAEALEKGDTPELAGDGGIYHLWTDYEASLSDEEMQEAEETGEWPDVENSVELVQINSVKRADEDEIAAYVKEHGPANFQYDTTE